MSDTTTERQVFAPVLLSDNGVIYLGSDDTTERVVLSIPSALLVALAKAWANDARISEMSTSVDHRVRELFDGADGELGFLREIGCDR